MSDAKPTSGQIIPFPVQRATPVADEGQERLKRALASLDEAVIGQRNAVAAWRGALDELRTVMAGLGNSVQRYRDSLDTLNGRVAQLHGQAVQLEQTADAALAVRSD